MSYDDADRMAASPEQCVRELVPRIRGDHGVHHG